MGGTGLLALDKAAEIIAPPPPGAPNSVPLEGSELPGRSKVYRHWRFKDALLETLDPAVCLSHLGWRSFWETDGDCAGRNRTRHL